ncbi:hypothetical protein [Lunatimonas lonarensis]|nr:hypothetical protein [Lunatimonas lonarensis]
MQSQKKAPFLSSKVLSNLKRGIRLKCIIWHFTGIFIVSFACKSKSKACAGAEALKTRAQVGKNLGANESKLMR